MMRPKAARLSQGARAELLTRTVRTRVRAPRSRTPHSRGPFKSLAAAAAPGKDTAARPVPCEGPAPSSHEPGGACDSEHCRSFTIVSTAPRAGETVRGLRARPIARPAPIARMKAPAEKARAHLAHASSSWWGAGSSNSRGARSISSASITCRPVSSVSAPQELPHFRQCCTPSSSRRGASVSFSSVIRCHRSERVDASRAPLFDRICGRASIALATFGFFLHPVEDLA